MKGKKIKTKSFGIVIGLFLIVAVIAMSNPVAPQVTCPNPDIYQVAGDSWMSHGNPVTFSYWDKNSNSNQDVNEGYIIEGTDAGEVINGSDKDYLIKGKGGVDQICGRDGDDTIKGGKEGPKGSDSTPGDTLYGDDGDDTLLGGWSNDWLIAGDGNDTLQGGWGEDRLFGNAGNDTLKGGKHDDQLAGQEGDDKLYGGHGDDKLWGGNGDETNGDTCDTGKHQVFGFEDECEL
jgi:Ca2+-binding RTX toxin-like protein